MDILAVINSFIGVSAARIIARILPPKSGYRFAESIAAQLSKNKESDLVRAIRLNQWIASRKTLDHDNLDSRVHQVLVSTARCLFDFYRLLGRKDNICSVVDLPGEMSDYFSPHRKQNAVFVTTHLSNFDLVGQALGYNGFQFQILSYPDPGSGYNLQNELRRKSGHVVTPMSFESLHQARKHLEHGGNVLTGLDRPIASPSVHPTFFGYPSALPVAYTRLALQAGVPVVLVSAVTKEKGQYLLYMSKPIWMKTSKEITNEYLRNTEAVLEQAEYIIDKYPTQWSMFYPVWPEMAESVP